MPEALALADMLHENGWVVLGSKVPHNVLGLFHAQIEFYRANPRLVKELNFDKEQDDILVSIVSPIQRARGDKLREVEAYENLFDSTYPETALVRKNRTTEKSSQVATPRQPSIKMKDAAAEKLAQKQEDELAALFDTPELAGENENPAVNGALDHHSENAPRAGSASRNAAVALNRKPAVAKGTEEIVPQPASEVKRRIQTYRNGDITVRVNDIPTLLRDLGTLFRMRYMGRSRYATYEAQIGDITFRLKPAGTDPARPSAVLLQ